MLSNLVLPLHWRRLDEIDHGIPFYFLFMHAEEPIFRFREWTSLTTMLKADVMSMTSFWSRRDIWAKTFRSGKDLMLDRIEDETSNLARSTLTMINIRCQCGRRSLFMNSRASIDITKVNAGVENLIDWHVCVLEWLLWFNVSFEQLNHDVSSMRQIEGWGKRLTSSSERFERLKVSRSRLRSVHPVYMAPIYRLLSGICFVLFFSEWEIERHMALIEKPVINWSFSLIKE